jgi:hypothetical protein
MVCAFICRWRPAVVAATASALAPPQAPRQGEEGVQGPPQHGARDDRTRRRRRRRRRGIRRAAVPPSFVFPARGNVNSRAIAARRTPSLSSLLSQPRSPTIRRDPSSRKGGGGGRIRQSALLAASFLASVLVALSCQQGIDVVVVGVAC